jgi:prevent-host-death family protein
MATRDYFMTRVSVVKAKVNFSRLLAEAEAEAEAGREVVITRRGEPVARISGVAPKKRPFNLKSAAAFRAQLPPAKPGASDLIRRLRDERY